MVDEKTLYDTFSRFGSLIQPPKIARDESSLSKGYGFVSYASFEASDDAIANMNGQYLMNKDISVQYAYKKDGKGERHGDAAERALAAQAKKHNVIPELQAMPPGLLLGINGIPQAPAAMLNDSPMSSAPPGFPPQRSSYNSVPPPGGPRGAPGGPPQHLPPPPSGLPQRPPPSHAGYGGPQMDFHGHAPPTGPAGFGQPPTGPARGMPQFPPGFAPPGGMPSGMAPPPGFGGMQASPGFGGPQGMPMGMPPTGPSGHGAPPGYNRR